MGDETQVSAVFKNLKMIDILPQRPDHLHGQAIFTDDSHTTCRAANVDLTPGFCLQLLIDLKAILCRRAAAGGGDQKEGRHDE